MVRWAAHTHGIDIFPLSVGAPKMKATATRKEFTHYEIHESDCMSTK